MLKKWIQNIKNRWTNLYDPDLDEDFEITEFDHIPFIDETLRVSQ